MAPASSSSATTTAAATGNFPRGKKKSVVATPKAATNAAPKTKKRKHRDADQQQQQQQQASEAVEEDAATTDVLFGKKAAKDKEKEAGEEKRPKKSHKKSAKSDVSSAHDSATLKKESATVVTFKTLSKGALLLGCVRQINESDLVVSLPNKLNGIVSKEHCGDEFFERFQRQQHKQQQQKSKLLPPPSTDGDEDMEPLPALDAIFSVGQFVPCVVLECAKNQKHKTIHLSLRLSLLHSEFSPASIQKAMALHGTIASIEDHGAIVNLGVRGLNAFVPLKEVEAQQNQSFLVGQQKFFVVTAMNQHTSTATLSCDAAQTLKNVTRGDSFTIKQLLPGMLLNIRVEDVLTNGLSVNFLSFFHGTVEQNHMSFPGVAAWQDKFRKGMKGRARIVAVNRVAKTVCLSMAPQVVHLNTPTFEALSIGDIVEEATVERIDAGIGMLLSLPSAQQPPHQQEEQEPTEDKDKGSSWKSFCAAYVHISNCDDGHVDKLDKKFKLGQKVRSRVIGFAPFDALVNVTLKSSSLAQKVLRHVDLQAGEKVSQCRILAIEKWGLLVELSEGVRGLVTAQHVPVFKKMKSKYKVGQKVDVRVLQVDVVNKKTFLTMKKGLLQSTLPPLSSYEQAATSGTIAHGFVTKIADYGLVVSFYSGVYGLVPAALLRQNGIEDISEAYEIGQVVKVAVTRCDLARKRLILTLDTTKTMLNGSSTGKAKLGVSADVLASGKKLIGQVISNVKVLEKESAFVRVQTSDGLEGVLPVVHLCDTPRAELSGSAVDQFLSRYQVDDEMTEELLVLSQTKDGVLNLSMKPQLLRAAKDTKMGSWLLPDSIEAVEQEQKSSNRPLVGFVASVHSSHGVFVRFLNDLTALAPKGLLQEKFLSSSDGLFQVGDTVRCVVDKIVADKRQLLVSLKKNPLGIKADAAFFQSMVQANTRLVQTHDDDHLPWKNLKVGSSVKAEFVGMRPYGAVFTLADDDQVTVLVSKDHCDKDDDNDNGNDDDTCSWATEGKKSKLLLVDYDFSKRIFYGIVNDDQLVASGSKKQKKQRSRLNVGQDIKNVRVVALPSHKQYAIASFQDAQKADLVQLAVLQLADFWCPYQTADELDLTLDSVVPKCRVASTNGSSDDDEDSPFSALAVLTIAEDKPKASRKPVKGDEVSLPKYSELDLSVGKKVEGVITGIKEDSMEIKVRVSKKVGKVSVSVSIVDVDVDTSASDDECKHPLDQFSVNTKVTGVIIGMIVKGANQRKPVSESNPPVFRWLTLSLKHDDVTGDDKRALVRVDWDGVGREQLHEGKTSRLRGVVVENSKQGVLVRLSHRVTGFCHCLELSRDLAVLKNFAKHFPVGKAVQVFVLNVDEEAKRVDLSLVRAATDELPLAPGNRVVGMINTKIKAIRPPCVMVELAAHTFGRACVTELVPEREWSDKLLDKPEFAHGKFVEAMVLQSKHAGAIELTLRSDALARPEEYANQVAAKRVERAVAVGDLVQGFVASTTTRGCFVRLDGATVARVLLRDLSDDFVKNPVDAFPVGKLVAGRVTKVVPATEQRERLIELSLKASVVAEDSAMVRWSDLKEGKFVKGTITRVQQYGVFVKIENSNISGLCHISEIADERIETPLDQVFSEGDYVKAKILKIEDRRVSFGLKPSYFEGEEESSEEEEDEDSGDEEEAQQEEQPEAMEVDEESDRKVAAAANDLDDEDDESDDDDDEDNAMEVDEEPAASSVEFTWDGFKNVLDSKHKSTGDDEDSNDSDDEEEDSSSQKKTLKKKNSKQKDEWIALREKALASGDATPQTAEDFERLVAVSPNSSYLWIQYMAFHVAMTEIQLARDVAIRATSSVSYRDEKEKLNVWVAYLNLEHDFGDEYSFSRVFKSALQVNAPKAIYLQLVDLYSRANEVDDADTTVQTMLKKFKKSKKVWLRAIQWHLDQQQFDLAAETLQRSTKSLAAHKHLFVITKYGQLLYEKQQLDKARTIFEGVLATYPKRVDLWNLYLDKEIKFADVESARRLFERVVSLDFSAKKMKFLFKKFVQFEQSHGDDDSVQHVKQLAREFVENSAASSS